MVRTRLARLVQKVLWAENLQVHSSGPSAPTVARLDVTGAHGSLLLWQRVLLLSSAVAMFHLAAQASAPSAGAATPPAGINWIALLLAIGAGCVLYRHGDLSHRFACILSGAGLLYVLWLTRVFAQPSREHLASRLSEGLSATMWSVPLGGLLVGWAVLGAGFLAGEALVFAAGGSLTSRRSLVRGAATLLSVVTCAFGERAVIGYVSGAASLLP